MTISEEIKMKSKRVVSSIMLMVSMTIIFPNCAGNLDHNWDEPEFAQLEIISKNDSINFGNCSLYSINLSIS